jgi:hypothetical protein
LSITMPDDSINWRARINSPQPWISSRSPME